MSDTFDNVGGVRHPPSFTPVVWKIQNYFDYPKRCILKSPTFKFLEADWYLEWWQTDTDEEDTRPISLYLCTGNSIPHEYQILLSIGIIGRDGSMVENRSLVSRFDEEDDSGFYDGWIAYFNILDQEKDDIVPDGVLTIVCIMNTYEDIQETTQAAEPLGIEKLVHDFKNLLQSEEATDVTVIVKNQEFKVHRAVLLVRSRVFCAMFKHDTKEKKSGIITIDDCDPGAFQQFVTYLYSGDVENFSSDTVFSLYKIADKYEADDLRRRCVRFLKNNLSAEIFCDALSLSLRHGEYELLKVITKFFAKNLKNILVTPQWISFVRENPMEANELYLKAADYFSFAESKYSQLPLIRKGWDQMYYGL